MSPLAGPPIDSQGPRRLLEFEFHQIFVAWVQNSGNVAAILDHERDGIVQPGIIAVSETGAVKHAVMDQAFGADLQAGNEFLGNHIAAIGEGPRIVQCLGDIHPRGQPLHTAGAGICPPA